MKLRQARKICKSSSVYRYCGVLHGYGPHRIKTVMGAHRVIFRNNFKYNMMPAQKAFFLKRENFFFAGRG